MSNERSRSNRIASASGVLRSCAVAGAASSACRWTGRQRLLAGVSSLVLLGLPFGFTTPASARCSDNAPASGTVVTCDTTAPNPDTQGVNANVGSTNVTVTVDPAAAISAPFAIVVRDQSTVTIAAGASISAQNIGVIVNNQSSATNNGTIDITSVTAVNREGVGLTAVGNDNRLTNNGTITSAANPALVGGISAFGDNNVITNSAGATITTNGNDSNGMKVDGGTGSTSINDGTIITNGQGGGHFVSTPIGMDGVGDRHTVINNGTIRTNGTWGIGIFGNGTGLTLTNTGTITTAADNGIGFQVLANTTAVSNSGTVTTAGAGAYGVEIAGFTNTLTNTGTITTAAAHGVIINGDGNSVVSSGRIDASGAGSAGVIVVSAAGSNTSIVNQAGGVISAASGFAIAGGDGNETVDNSGTLNGPGTGTPAMSVFLGGGTDSLTLRSTAVVQAGMDGGTGNDTLTFDQFTYTGGGGLVNWETFSLTNGSSLTLDSDLVMGDSGSLTGSVGIDATSTVNVFADRTIRPFDAASLVTVTNAGTINLSNGVAGSRLTIAGNYVGAGGRVVLDTFLGGDGSPSDVLVISGGTATGTTVLQIVNAGGPGVLTTGNGILVVDAINSATTAVDAFNLGGATVAAGPYNYTLFRGSSDATNPEAWYLRSRLDCALVPNDPACQPSPGNPPVDPPEGPPDIRQEVSLYTAIPSMALIYGRTMLDTLHERVGEEEQLRGRADLAGQSMANGAWGRVIGLTGDRDGANNGVLGSKGPKFEYSMVALQLGMDIYRKEHSDGSRDHAGLYGAYGQIYGDVWHYRGGRAGQDKLKAFSVGGYWTHFGAEGWYLDAVLQGTWYDATGRSNRDGLKLSTNGFGLAASLEGGYPFKFDQGWLVEPQVQLVYQHLWLDKSGDAAARVTFKDAESLAGRIGVRLAKTWQNDLRSEAMPDTPRKTTMWLRTNLWHEFKGKSRTEFGSADGPVGFTSSLGGTSVEITAGMTAQFSRTGSLFWSVGYGIGLDGKSHAYNGKAGLRFNW